MVRRVELAPRAARQFRHLPADAQRRIRPRIDALADDPRPRGAEQLSGPEPLFRIRVGDYRVIYALREEVLLVLIVKVGHRRDVYRGLPG